MKTSNNLLTFTDTTKDPEQTRVPLTVFTCIWEEPISNLGQAISYCDVGFLCLHYFIQANTGTVPPHKPQLSVCKSVSTHHS